MEDECSVNLSPLHIASCPRSKKMRSLNALKSQYTDKSSKDLDSISVSGNKQIANRQKFSEGQTLSSLGGIKAKFISKLNNKIKDRMGERLRDDEKVVRSLKQKIEKIEKKAENENFRSLKFEMQSFKNFTESKRGIDDQHSGESRGNGNLIDGLNDRNVAIGVEYARKDSGREGERERGFKSRFLDYGRFGEKRCGKVSYRGRSRFKNKAGGGNGFGF